MQRSPGIQATVGVAGRQGSSGVFLSFWGSVNLRRSDSIDDKMPDCLDSTRILDEIFYYCRILGRYISNVVCILQRKRKTFFP